MSADVARDVDAYVDLLTDEQVAHGRPQIEARRQALVDVGSVAAVCDAVDDERTGALWRPLVQDLRYALRLIRRSPGLTSAIVLAMALGIAATSTTFSAVDAVLLRPLPYADANRLVVLLHRGTDPVSAENALDWQRSATAFEALGAAEYWSPNLAADRDSPPDQVLALHLTAEVLPMLGARPELGRLPAAGPDFSREVVIADGLWRRRFGADPGIVGRVIGLDAVPHVIVGVMPATFHFAPFWATRAELWGGLVLTPDRGGDSLRVFAKLRRGVTLARARAEMATVTAALDARAPGTNRQITVTPLLDKVVGDVRAALLVLFGAVGCVLVMACSNVAHLLLARAVTREREFAVRCALGASRARVVRQLLTESVAVSVLGGALGVALASFGVRVFTTLGATSVPRLTTMQLDARVLIFATILSVFTGVVFGLAPARALARIDVTAGLRTDDRGTTTGRTSRRTRRLLISSQVALALVLVVGAGLLVRTFVAVRAIDPGFVPDHVASLVVSVAGTAEAAPGRRAAFYADVLTRVEALPAIRSAAFINHMPLAGDVWGVPFRLAGRPLPRPGRAPTATFRVISPGYFATMGIRLVGGRAFTNADRAETEPVVIVNARLAEDSWPGAQALGERLQVRFGMDDDATNPPWRTVVGVTANTVRGDVHDAPEPEVFLPFAQSRAYSTAENPHVEAMTLVVRTAEEPAPVLPVVRAAVRALAPDVPVSDLYVLSHVIDEEVAGTRFTLALLGGFAAVALLLASLGVFGVVSHDVSSRRRELGIRLALGASRRQVVMDLARDGVRSTVVGLAVGLAGAWLLGDDLRSLLFGVTPSDGPTLALVTAAIAVVALVACLWPTIQASRPTAAASLK